MIGRVVLDGGCEVLRGGVVVARGEVLVAGVLGLERSLALRGRDLCLVREERDGSVGELVGCNRARGADRPAAHVG